MASSLSLACSGTDGGPDSIDGGFVDSSHECHEGEEKRCATTLKQENGVLSCLEGTASCEEGVWSECGDGTVVKRPSPNHRDFRGNFKPLHHGSTTETDCVTNPCDPQCQTFIEDPPDLTTMSMGGPMVDDPNNYDWTSSSTTSACGIGSDPCQANAAPAVAGCHPCIDQICAMQPSCCTTAWDSTCAGLVNATCDQNVAVPPSASLCDYAAFGETSVRLGNGTGGFPVIGSNGTVRPEPPANMGNIFAKGLVDIRNSNNIQGNIVTEGDVWFEAPSTITGDITSGGRVDVRNNSVIGGGVSAVGDIWMAADSEVNGDLWAGGRIDLASGADALMNASAVGNITGQASGRIWGDANVEPPSTISAVITVDGARNAAGPVSTPSAPSVTLPSLSDYERDLSASCSVASGRPAMNIWSGHVTLPPGIYGDVTVYSGYNLILQEGGEYVFDSLNFFAGGHLRLDGSPAWNVSVCSTYRTDNGHTVYLDGTTTVPDPEDFILYSDDTSGDCISIGDSNTFNGMFLAPRCTIRVYNSSTATAALWGETVYTNTSFSLFNIPTMDCEGARLFGATCGTVPLYADGATYSAADEVFYDGTVYRCTVGGWCSTGGGFGGGAGYWPGEGLNWNLAWTAVGGCPADPAVGGSSCTVTLDLPATTSWDNSPCRTGSDCQNNYRCTEVETSPSCSHSKCLTGAALTDGCDPCVTSICADPSYAYCCTGTWDADCVTQVKETCDAFCGTVSASACTHDMCSTGAALDVSCDSCVQLVCDQPGAGHCCDTSGGTWDQTCVDKVMEVCGDPGTQLCDYAVLGTTDVSTGDRCSIAGGGIGGDTTGPGMTIDYGCSVEDVYATNDVYLYDTTAQDVYSTGTSYPDATTSTSSTNDGATVNVPWIERHNVSPGSTNYTWTGGSRTLRPGQYGDVFVFDDGSTNTSLELLADGVYHFERLVLREDTTLIYPAEGTVKIYVNTQLEFGARHDQEDSDGALVSNDALRIHWYAAFDGAGAVQIETDAEVYGMFSVPDGTITAVADSTIHGTLHAATVDTHDDVVVDAVGLTSDACEAAVTTGLCDYAVFARDYLQTNTNALVAGGPIGGGTGGIDIDNGSSVEDVYSFEDIDLNNASTAGNLTAGGSITLNGGSTALAQASPVDIVGPAIPSPTFSCGGPSNNFFSGNNTLSPGSYGNIDVINSGTTLDLEEGDYYIQGLNVNSQSQLRLPATGTVRLHICGHFNFGDTASMDLVGGGIAPLDALRFQVHYGSNNSATYGPDATVYGVFMHPQGTVTVGDRSTIYGMIYANQVQMNPDSAVVAAGLTGSQCEDADVDELPSGAPPGPAFGESLCDYALYTNGAISVNGNPTQVKGAPVGGPNCGSSQVVFGDIDGAICQAGVMFVSSSDYYGDLCSASTTVVASTAHGGASVTDPCTAISSPTIPTGDYSCTGADGSHYSGTNLGPGQYDTIQEFGGTYTLSAGEYWIRTLTLGSGSTLQLAGDGPVTINVCNSLNLNTGGTASTMRLGGTASPSPADALDLRFYSQPSINFGQNDVMYGVFFTEGQIAMNASGATLYGMGYAKGSVAMSGSNTSIFTAGISGSACRTSGVDPNIPATPAPPTPPAPSCPVNTPVGSTITETGTCVDNGTSFVDTVTACTDADLSIAMACDDTVRVCNHGNATVPAGSAVLRFYPDEGQQFAVSNPDSNWEVGTCTVANAIASGTCEDQVCPSALMDEDMTVAVNLDEAVTECSILDNWGYYADGFACGGVATPLTVTHTYEAANCPSGSSPWWGFLGWTSTTPGDSSIDFDVRFADASADLAAESFSTIYSATSTPDTQNCSAFTTCGDIVDVVGDDAQANFMEVEITLNPDGADNPILEDWEASYSCVYDQ